MKTGDIVASRYRLEQKLGMGGMGTVWSAQHTQTGRFFALKIMHSTVAANEDSRQRFLKEAKASARIDHPNVIDVLDVGELPEGQLFMAMELLEGLPLADALRLEPPLSVRELLVVLRETCAALAAAHTVGIVHRDVKPANIFLHRDRASGMIRPKILDFGVSKFAFLEESATHTGSLLGSPRYMSPEQARSAAQADLRSDVWSVGVILFEALTGLYPHEGDSFSNLVVAIATMPPRSILDVAPTVPPALASLVEDCLRPRDQRLPSCEVLAARIDDLLMTHDLAQVPCARGKGKKGVARPSDFVVRSTSELGWSTEARARASLSGGVAAPAPSAAATPPPAPTSGSLFDLPSATTNPIHTVDVPPPSQRTAEVTRPVAVAPRQAFDRAKTTPMAPTANELAGLLARVAQATGPSGTMGLGPSAGSLHPPHAPAPARSEQHRAEPPGAGEQTQIHARRPQPPSHAPDAATRLMTLPDPDAATPMLSRSISLSGVPSPSPSTPYQPAMPSFEPRDHLVESVSTFGVERHRPTSMMPGTAPSGDALASRRRNAGAVIAAASLAMVGLVAVLLLVMGRGGNEPAAASPVAPGTGVAAAPPEAAPQAAPEPPEATTGASSAPPPPVASAAAAAPPAKAAPSATAAAAPPPSSAPLPSASAKLGAPWPTGAPPRPPAGPPPGRKGKSCAKDSIDCLGSGL